MTLTMSAMTAQPIEVTLREGMDFSVLDWEEILADSTPVPPGPEGD